jgi:hypothetical protein
MPVTKVKSGWESGNLVFRNSAGNVIFTIADAAGLAGNINNAVVGVGAAYKLARGTAVGTANLTAATGLTTITGYAVSPVGTTGTAANAAVHIMAKPQASTPGTLAIKRKKHTGPSTATLVAATVVGTVSWVAVGT